MSKKWAVRAALVVVALLPHAAAAGLGESDSIEKDRRAVFGVRKSALQTNQLYTVQSMTAGGVNINEYVNDSGVVFAVTWLGMRQPDLSVLLGAYYQEYKSKQYIKRAAGRRLSSVTTPNIVVQQGGHVRSIQGLAYVPALVPPGVNVGTLQ